MEISFTGPTAAVTAPSRGPDPEPLGSERFKRLTSRRAVAFTCSVGTPCPPGAAGGRVARARLPVPGFIPSEPALLSPYLTDGRRLLRVVSRAYLGSE
jgi:hypothetical protein